MGGDPQSPVPDPSPPCPDPVSSSVDARKARRGANGEGVQAAWRRIESNWPSGLLIALLALIVFEAALYGLNPLNWDLLFSTGVGVAVVDLWFARHLNESLNHTLDRLMRRSILTDSNIRDIRNVIQHRRIYFIIAGGMIGGATMVLAFIASRHSRTSYLDDGFLATLVGGGIVVGCVIGVMVLYGSIGRIMREGHMRLRTIPGHVDGASGTKPFGDFYLLQAGLMAIPAIFLSTWLYLIPVIKRYQNWQPTYVALLFASIVLEIIVFIWPMLSLHERMVESKQEQLKEADTVASAIADKQAQLLSASGAARDELQAIVKLLTDQFWSIENMSTWPIDQSIRKKFTIGNGLLLVSLASQLGINQASPWAKAADGIRQLFT